MPAVVHEAVEVCWNWPFEMSYGVGSQPDHSDSTQVDAVADPIVYVKDVSPVEMRHQM